MNCNDPKYNCVQTLPSSCIKLQTNEEFKAFKKSELSCDPDINELFHKYDDLVKLLQDSIDLTKLDKKTLIFDKAIIKPKDLFQILISLSSDMKSKLVDLEDRLNNFDVLSQTINIDLSCLGLVPCDNNSNNHSILSIITTLANGYCELKNSTNN